MLNGRSLFFFAVSAMFLYILSPLLLPLIMGGILAVLFYPWVLQLERRKLSRGAAAGLLTLGITLLLLLPAAFLIYLGAKNGLQELQALKTPRPGEDWVVGLLKTPFVANLVDLAGRFVPIDPSELVDTVRDIMLSVGSKAADLLGQWVTRLPGTVLDLVLIIVGVFFFLSDGPDFVAFVRRHSIFDPAQTGRILASLGAMCRSVVLASVLSGAAQALIMLLACVAVGQPNPVLVGVIVFVASFIPVIGSSPVTFGIGLYQLLGVSTGAGIGILIVALIVSGIDNVIRAIFLKGSADLHPLLAFVAAFGGLQAFGFLGIFVGPIVAALFLATLGEFTRDVQLSAR